VSCVASTIQHKQTLFIFYESLHYYLLHDQTSKIQLLRLVNLRSKLTCSASYSTPFLLCMLHRLS